MKVINGFILIVLLLGIGGFILMMQWDINVPQHQVEKEVDNKRFFNTTTRDKRIE